MFAPRLLRYFQQVSKTKWKLYFNTMIIRWNFLLRTFLQRLFHFRISDLIAWVNSSTGRVVLEWTAVGDDYDWGRAHRYQGAVTTSIEEASTRCSGQVLQSLPSPRSAASRETVSVYLKIDEKVSKICVVC